MPIYNFNTEFCENPRLSVDSGTKCDNLCFLGLMLLVAGFLLDFGKICANYFEKMHTCRAKIMQIT